MNKRTEQTRWTPKRLLSLLMALIMTLSLLPTAALAAADDYTGSITDAPAQLITKQQSANITATLTNTSSANKTVGLRLIVSVPTGSTGELSTVSVNYNLSTTSVAASDVSSIPLVAATTVATGASISNSFNLTFGTPGEYLIEVKAVEDDGTGTTFEYSLDSKAITVKDAIESLTVVPTNPEAGKPFTVRADTNVDSGHVAFTYNGDTKSVPVSPLPDTKGYAEYTFIADATVVSTDAISATLFDTTGILGTKKTDLTLATPATNYTVVFRANGDNVYSLPAPQTVKSGGYAVMPITPERKGYTFGGWYKDPSCPDTATAFDFNAAVTGNLELYAKWTATPVMIEITNDNGSDVNVNGLHPNSSIGDKVHFIVKVPAKYNTADLRVTAGNYVSSYIVLSPVDRVEVKNKTTGAVESVVLYYQFTVEEDMTYEDPPTV